MRIIYNSLMYPHLQYGNIVWGNAAMKHLNKLITSQKRAIRNISHAEYLQHTGRIPPDYLQNTFKMPSEFIQSTFI